MRTSWNKNHWFGLGVRGWREREDWIVVLTLGRWHLWISSGTD